jgi:hypothetical protein
MSKELKVNDNTAQDQERQPQQSGDRRNPGFRALQVNENSVGDQKPAAWQTVVELPVLPLEKNLALGGISTPAAYATLVRASGVDGSLACEPAGSPTLCLKGTNAMANPWLKKNPLMSMWLSSANAAAGRARSIASAETSKQQAELTKQTVRFWTRAWQSAVKPRRHR